MSEHICEENHGAYWRYRDDGGLNIICAESQEQIGVISPSEMEEAKNAPPRPKLQARLRALGYTLVNA